MARSGQMTLNGGTIVVPAALDDLTITVPFTFTATLNRCSGGCRVNPTIFTVELVGSGTATLELNFSGLDLFGSPIFFFQKATFEFEEVVAVWWRPCPAYSKAQTQSFQVE